MIPLQKTHVLWQNNERKAREQKSQPIRFKEELLRHLRPQFG